MKKIIIGMMLALSINSILCMENSLNATEKAEPNAHGLVEMMGLRKTMEDETDVQIKSDHAFFAVYDGHNGKDVASIAKYNLYRMCQLDQAKTDDEIKAALRNAFLTMQEGLSNAVVLIGSTATVALIKNGKIFVANAGDSRTVLCSNGTAIPLSEDHKPNRDDERKRIEGLGGKVVLADTWRVAGILALSRALGDKHFHPFVIADPEITVRDLDTQDEFLILACDGIWDVLENQEAVFHVKNTLINHRNDYTQAARHLAYEALKRNSTDNISAIVVNLKSFMQK